VESTGSLPGGTSNALSPEDFDKLPLVKVEYAANCQPLAKDQLDKARNQPNKLERPGQQAELDKSKSMSASTLKKSIPLFQNQSI